MNQIPAWGWAVFAAVVVSLLAVDLIAHRGRRAESAKRALVWSVIWIGAGLAFNVFVWVVMGAGPAQEYLAAYLIEKSLSLDNIFLFLVIFQSLNIPKEQHHHVLFLGILGAVVFRGIFIFLGIEVLDRYDWIAYIFGAILLYAAFEAYRQDPSQKRESGAVKWLSRRFPITTQTHGGQFFAREAGKWVATPLLIALVAIEITDVVFAIDSVAAALSMTRNMFILYSSNIFAILGLRALYLLAAHTIAELRYLHYGLAVVLAFAALKLMLHGWIEIPPLLSVAVIVVVIGGASWASLRARHQQARGGRPGEQHG